MKITKNTEIRKSQFGDRYVIDVPGSCDAVVLCTNSGKGMRPFGLCMPHQIYVDKVEKAIEERPDTRWVTVIPVRSFEYIDILHTTEI